MRRKGGWREREREREGEREREREKERGREEERERGREGVSESLVPQWSCLSEPQHLYLSCVCLLLSSSDPELYLTWWKLV